MKARVLWLCLVFCTLTFTSRAQDPVADVVKFSDYSEGSIDRWLSKKGFQAEHDAKRRDRVDLEISRNGLSIKAKRKALGLFFSEKVNVHEFSFVEIDWGVVEQPSGASYEQGIRNEAIMVILFMGDERFKSGSMFIPDSPYFIGLFLCSGDDRVSHPYTGSYFKKTGRYVCTDRPKAGDIVTSRFNLVDAYRQFFDKEKDDNPGISGIALGLDTSKAKGQGTSSAFIREIRIFR